MKSKQLIYSLSASAIALILLMSLSLLSSKEQLINISDRNMHPSLDHILGTDELGRDLFYRFLGGTRYTVITVLATFLLSTAFGYILATTVKAGPKWASRILHLIAHFVLLVPTRIFSTGRGRWFVGVSLWIAVTLYLHILTATAVGITGFTGWRTILIVFPWIAIGTAFLLSTEPSHRTVVRGLRVIFIWSVSLHSALDIVGLGVLPPETSWASVFMAQGASLAAQAAVTIGFFVLTLSVFWLLKSMFQERED